MSSLVVTWSVRANQKRNKHGGLLIHFVLSISSFSSPVFWLHLLCRPDATIGCSTSFLSSLIALIMASTDMITFMSFKYFIRLIEGYPIPFAVNYTLGNVLAMSASGFLCGPKRQLRNMFDDKRKLVATVYISCLASTLVVTFIPLPSALKLLALIILLITQCGANIWYSLSYIPLGRKTALRLIKKFLGLENSSGGGEGFMGLGSSGEMA